MPPTRSGSRSRSRARDHNRDATSHTRRLATPRSSAKHSAKDDNSAGSILSSVFTFVSREFDSFLSTATGREPHVLEDEEDDEEDQSYDEGEQDGYSTPVPVQRKSSRSARAQNNRSNCQSSKQTQPKRRLEASKIRGSRSKSSSEEESSGSEVEKPGRRRVVNASELRNAIEEFEAPIHSDSSDAASPPPKTTRSALRIKKSFTMPGSLFDRTSSLEPTPEPEARRLANRTVRFVSDDDMSDADETFETPRAEPDDQRAGPSTPRAPIPAFKLSNTNSNPLQVEGNSEDDEVTEVTPGPSRPKATTNTTPASSAIRAPSRTPTVTRKCPSPEPILPSSSPIKTPTRSAKGKERAVDPLPIPPPADRITQTSNETISSINGGIHGEYNSGSGSDTSYMANLKGKQRELDTAMQKEAECGTNMSFDEEERARDKARIQLLEQELKSLREELAKRPIGQPLFIAPPPPPPPPPPPLNFTMRTSQGSDTSFADVRAALRPTDAPNEKPINPAYDNTTKRKGQPTINLGADMMVAFLTEMKTHRLRKIGSGTDNTVNYSSQPAIRVREVGADVGNRTEVAIRPREALDVGNRTEVLPRRKAFATPAPLKASKLSNLVRQESTSSESDKNLSKKRKHVEDEPTSFASKRRALASPATSANILGGLSDVRGPATVQRARTSKHAQPQERLSALSFNSQPPPDSSGSSRNNSITSNATSTSTGITTPSLLSDNGSRDEMHDRSPPTPKCAQESLSRPATTLKGKPAEVESPPRIPASSSLNRRTVPIPVEVRHEEEDDDVIEVEAFDEFPQQNRSKVIAEKPRDMTLDSFWGRGPTGGKLIDSPRRPMPPSRKVSSARGTPVKSPAQIQSGPADEEDEDKNSQLTDVTIMAHAEESPVQVRKGPIRPPPGMFKAPPPPATSSRPPRFNRSFDVDKSRSFASAPNMSTTNGVDGTVDEEENEIAEETFILPKAKAKAKKASKASMAASMPIHRPQEQAADETFLIPTSRTSITSSSQGGTTRRKPRDSLDLELRRAEPSLLLDIDLNDEMEHRRMNGGLGFGRDLLESDVDVDADGEVDELEYGYGFGNEESGERTFFVPIQDSHPSPILHSQSRSTGRSRSQSQSRSRSGPISTTKANGKRNGSPHISSVHSFSSTVAAPIQPLKVTKKSGSSKSRSNSMSRSRSRSRSRTDSQEPSVYETTGTGSRRPRGFLAHGGAGGAPVVMGEGYVEGLGLSLSNVYDFDGSSAGEDVDDARDGDYIPQPVVSSNPRRKRL